MVMISGSEADFKTWVRERPPRFDEATGRSWPLLAHSGPEDHGVARDDQFLDVDVWSGNAS